MKLIRLFFLLMVGSFLASKTFGQGVLMGSVYDAEQGETVIGANILIEELGMGAATDFDGLYIIRNVPSGFYTVRVSSIGYETQIFEKVEIKDQQSLTLKASLGSGTTLLEEITVVEARRTHTEVAVLQEIKGAKQVVSGVSSQQIAKSQDGNAALVMQRIPGVTIVENRFVMIRGLSERYNNVMINNVIAPSTEVDKRTFSFDLIASNALDRMLIFKSGSADNPGDFAGGVIKLYTVDAVEKDYLQLSLGMGLRLGTTGNPYFQSQGSATDFLGFDNGFRSLPGDFPGVSELKNSPRNSTLRRDAARSLTNNWNPNQGVALPDHSLGLGFGKNIQLKGGRKLTTLNNINYSTSFLSFERDFFRYFEWEDRTRPILTRFAYQDDNYQKDTRISVLSNWNLKLSNKSRIKFRNLFNQIGENETILRRGFDFIQRPDDNLENYLLGYRSRSIYTGQLEGEHKIDDNKNMGWVLGFSYLRENEPDLRRFRTYRPKDQGDQPFIMQLPPSSNLFETGRYYGTLNEYSLNQGANYDAKKEVSVLGSTFSSFLLKTGYYADYRQRNFNSRYFSYLYPGGLNDPAVLRELERLPLTEIFRPENFDVRNAFVIEEGTRNIDTYTASSFTGAAFGSAELSGDLMTVSLGLRSEYNIQTLDTRDDIGSVNVVRPVLAFLPFLNFSHGLGPNGLLRFAYGRTLNRPEFRELAPFLFYDYKLEAARVGNPNLVTATIDNIDLRFETYPRGGETFSIGIFYKYFNNPIENRTIITTEQPSFTYINADFARNFGLELELRKSLKGVTNWGFLDGFAMNINASIIYSTVDLGETAVAQDRVRPLQGQSPYIVNAALYYEGTKGWTSSVVYNVFGNRIFSVGDVLFPTIFELSRNSLDVSVIKRFSKGTSVKFGISDVLNAPFRFYEDSDRDGKITNQGDNPIFTFQRGQIFQLSLTFDLL
jgi:hypothetical protein